MRHGFRSLVRYFLCCFGLCGITASAQTLQVITLAAHRERLPQLRAAVESCYRDTLLCAAANTIADESFPLSNGVLTHVSYAWLRDGMTALAKAKPEDRKKAADRLLLRLNASDDVKPSPVAAAEARVEADSVLSQVEFAKSKPNILQQQWERFKDWLNQRLTTGSDMRGAVPWLRFLLEAALFGVPLLLLGLWLLRQVREDRLRPSFARDAAKKPAKEEVSWLELSQTYAQAGEWRDAVHALYWHSVTVFEQRRIWSVARHRTPREYLRLLEAGSRHRMVLRELTMLLEQVWYGHADASETDFLRAAQLSGELTAT